MPVLPVLSVEVWQIILRFSISTAEFLDPNAFEGDLQAHEFSGTDRPKFDEAVYWESERTLNTPQCVCTAWDAYLRRFERRYVRMGDIMHRRIDEKSIKKAARISFYRDPCTCREVCYRSSPGSRGPVLPSIISQFCCETLLRFHDLPAEILDTDTLSGDSLWDAGALRNLRELKVIIAPEGFCSEGIDIPLLSLTPTLKHLRGEVRDSLQYLHFISRTLVTLALRVEREESCENLVLDLPALRHLRVDFGGGVVPLIIFEGTLVPFFRKMGGQLRSLHLRTWDRPFQMPAEIWEMCSSLERFHPSVPLAASAPMSHPLHTLSITLDHIPHTLELRWLKLRRLIWEGRWSVLHDRNRLRLSEILALWARELQGRGVRFEDRDGVTLESVMRRKV